MSDEWDIRRKRLLFRSKYRGIKEADLLLGSFADRYLAEFGSTQMDEYEALLEENDADLLDWITGRATPPAERQSEVLTLLMAYRYAKKDLIGLA